MYPQMHWWSYDCLAKAWRQRYCCEKWVLSKENWFVSTKCGQRGQCCVIHFSHTFRYIHYSEVVFLYQEHLYRFCPPFFTAKWYQNRDFFFHRLALWLLTSVTGYPGALWLALWDLDTLFLLVHLYLSIALSSICTYNMREEYSLVLKEIL